MVASLRGCFVLPLQRGTFLDLFATNGVSHCACRGNDNIRAPHIHPLIVQTCKDAQFPGNPGHAAPSENQRSCSYLIRLHKKFPTFTVFLSAHTLQHEVQTRFEFGFQRRAPHLSLTQRLSATISVHLFKAVLPLLLQAERVSGGCSWVN